jgi:hypothetical protein
VHLAVAIVPFALSPRRCVIVQVITMYEQHRWGWPGKESPEMQMPGSWTGDRDIRESMDEAEEERHDPNAPANPLANKDPNRGNKKVVEGKYKAAIDARDAARKSDRGDFVSAPGKNILVAAQQGVRALHDVDRNSAGASKKAPSTVVSPQQAEKQMEALARKSAATQTEEKAKSKYDSQKYKPGKGYVIGTAKPKVVKHKDINIFDMDKMKQGKSEGVFKHDLLDDNIPPKELARMEAAKKAAAANKGAAPAPGAVNVKALKAMWGKEAKQAKAAKGNAVSKKADKAEVVPKIDLNARGTAPEKVRTEKIHAEAPAAKKVVPAAKPKAAAPKTGKMVTPEEAEKKLMAIEKNAEQQGHAVNSPDQHYKPAHASDTGENPFQVRQHEKAGYARKHPNA